MRVTARNLRKQFGRTRALDDLSFDIADGEIVAILGPNGAGKTMLLNLLGSLLVPSDGTLLLDDHPLKRSDLALRRRIAIVPDSPVWLGQSTVVEHILAVLHLYEHPLDQVDQTVPKTLETLDILPLYNSPLAKLSRGQLFKTHLAALFLLEPDLWLLDEPFASGIDPLGQRALRHHLANAATRGSTTLYSTQIVEVAEAFADRILLLEPAAPAHLLTRNEFVQARTEPSHPLHQAVTRLVGDA